MKITNFCTRALVLALASCAEAFTGSHMRVMQARV
jgi:hypothetical protein